VVKKAAVAAYQNPLTTFIYDIHLYSIKRDL
jgi:hypothetical protein